MRETKREREREREREGERGRIMKKKEKKRIIATDYSVLTQLLMLGLKHNSFAYPL